MAKDPATLWYWNDWNGGTMTFTRHLKGCYMDLLAAQFNSGPLSLEQIKTVLGTDQASWTVLSKKFKREVNSDGIEVFFNERMETEKQKRSEHSKKQAENVKKRWDKYNGNTTVYTKPIPLENEIENEKEFLKGGMGEKLLIPEMFSVFKKHLPNYPGDQEKDFHPLMAMANFIGKQLFSNGPPINNVALIIAEWEKICTWISQDNFYRSKSLKTISTHIQEIFQKKKSNATSLTKTKLGNKSGGFGILTEALRQNGE